MSEEPTGYWRDHGVSRRSHWPGSEGEDFLCLEAMEGLVELSLRVDNECNHFSLTPKQAREIARYLVALADTIDLGCDSRRGAVGGVSGWLAMLPERFQWCLHNVVAHPLSELVYQAGYVEMSLWVHDATMPEDRS